MVEYDKIWVKTGILEVCIPWIRRNERRNWRKWTTSLNFLPGSSTLLFCPSLKCVEFSIVLKTGELLVKTKELTWISFSSTTKVTQSFESSVHDTDSKSTSTNGKQYSENIFVALPFTSVSLNSWSLINSRKWQMTRASIRFVLSLFETSLRTVFIKNFSWIFFSNALKEQCSNRRLSRGSFLAKIFPIRVWRPCFWAIFHEFLGSSSQVLGLRVSKVYQELNLLSKEIQK